MADPQYDTNLPIYLQLMEQIQLWIVTGRWRAGERIPGVRELALECGVNPNTMQRALSELERTGLLYSERTAGRFVTRSEERIEEIRHEMAAGLIRDFLVSMERMGYRREQILSQLNQEMDRKTDISHEGERKTR